jgi:hypothetical protein
MPDVHVEDLTIDRPLGHRDAARVSVIAFPGARSDTLAGEMRELPRMVRFVPEDIVSITRTYLGSLSDIPPQAMPGPANLARLPATSILLSEYDDLRSSGELFEEQLRDVRCRSSPLLRQECCTVIST